jgi:hypothetical protein
MRTQLRFLGRTIGTSLTLLALAVPMPSAGAGTAQLTASWVDNSGGAATTRIERRQAVETAYTEVADAPPGATTFVDDSVAPGTTYCYRVFAWDDEAVSPYSNEACTTTAADAVTVAVSRSGNGGGTVVSTPAGINCGATCSATYDPGTSITLTATPAGGSLFSGWSGGGCAGTAACTFASNTSAAITATFSLAPVTTPTTQTLTVAKSGPGNVTGGNVTGAPDGITCGTACSASYPTGTTVTLTATPNSARARFAGWSGACAGSAATCTVVLNAQASVTATFKGGGK